MTPNYWMMVERYPHLEEEVGGSFPDCEISSLLDRTCQVVNCLLCFGVGMSAFYLKNELIYIVFSVTYSICKGPKLDP
jgi:hypothetical protein